MNLEAKSVALSISNGGQNKTPFSGTLVLLDTVSNFAPAGAHGRKVILTSQAAHRGLDTLLGMGIDYEHDRKTKIGAITGAEVLGTNLLIRGFLFATDHPEKVRSIKEHKDDLGLSFEAERVEFLSLDSPILTITSLVFTGAAVLLMSKAAFQATSLAASAARAHDTSPEAAAAARASNTKETKAMSFPNYTNVQSPERSALRPFPWSFPNPASLVNCLDNLGLVPPTVKASVTALAAAGQPLAAGGLKIKVHELDLALAQYDIDTTRRMQLKASLVRQGLLK